MRLRRLLFLTLGVVSFMAGTLAAQETPRAKRLATLKANLASVRTFYEGLSESDRRIFSSGAQNLFTLAKRVVDLEGRFGEEGPKESALRPALPEGVFGLGASGTQVSNPATDFILSQTAGFTQSETSTAWCGNIVVVGYNDSGSLFETLVFGLGGLSFNGVARSIDRGRTFTDLLFLDPGPITNFLGGDPVVACTSPTTFYYSSLLSQPGASGISVSKSTNGGLTYGTPVPAALKAAPAHFLDKSWMAVDPTNANRVFVTYTDFDNSGTSAACPGVGRVAIEIVRSVDGGATWTPPQVIDEVCRGPAISFPFVQGSLVAVGPDGEVYVTWERYDDFNPAMLNDAIDREIRSRKSIDNGATFAPFTKVADVFPSGDSFALRGGFRNVPRQSGTRDRPIQHGFARRRLRGVPRRRRGDDPRPWLGHRRVRVRRRHGESLARRRGHLGRAGQGQRQRRSGPGNGPVPARSGRRCRRPSGVVLLRSPTRSGQLQDRPLLRSVEGRRADLEREHETDCAQLPTHPRNRYSHQPGLHGRLRHGRQ